MSKQSQQTNVTKEEVFSCFQELFNLNALFTNGNKVKELNGLLFTLVAHDMTTIDDQEKENAFVVWKVGNLYVKLEGYLSSYGDPYLRRWSFVTPKEKVVQVFE